MDFDKPWTEYALEAEYEAFGFTRIAEAHNALELRNAKLIRGASRIRCERHRADATNAWGCPGCVAELRERERDLVDRCREWDAADTDLEAAIEIVKGIIDDYDARR